LINPEVSVGVRVDCKESVLDLVEPQERCQNDAVFQVDGHIFGHIVYVVRSHAGQRSYLQDGRLSVGGADAEFRDEAGEYTKSLVVTRLNGFCNCQFSETYNLGDIVVIVLYVRRNFFKSNYSRFHFTIAITKNVLKIFSYKMDFPKN
jgi:hypothetical protein